MSSRRRMGFTPSKATAFGLGLRAMRSSLTVPPAARGMVLGNMLASKKFLANTSAMVPVLEAAPLRGPVDKPLHVFAVFPGEMEKLARGQVGRFFSKKRLKTPAHVRTLPRLQAITSGGVPIVAQRPKQFLSLRHGRAFRSEFPGKPRGTAILLATRAAVRTRSCKLTYRSGNGSLPEGRPKRVLPTIERFTVLGKPCSWL